jgi:16S rRNA (guanine966-N2)-methyltransferase
VKGGNRVRIIGGRWGSRVLRFSPLERLRPTPDAVRERLFNWLGQNLAGRACLDLFAGSGALGFEAASRDAREVVLVERDRRALAALRENARALGAKQVEILGYDALRFLDVDERQFDVIFLDPPYGEGWTARLLPLLPRHLAGEGVVYLEQLEPRLNVGPEWILRHSGRTGMVNYYLLERSKTDEGRLSGDV